MARSGAQTRERILDAAEALVFQNGLAGTSIDRVIEQVGITKGAFFYHYANKNELADALIERFAARDRELLHGLLERAERMTSDPLQQVLVFLGLLSEHLESLDRPVAGCLFASYVYSSESAPPDFRQLAARAFDEWRSLIGEKLREAAARTPPARDFDPDEAADLLSMIFEGSLIMGRVYGEPNLVVRAVGQYRAYLEALFGIDGRAA